MKTLKLLIVLTFLMIVNGFSQSEGLSSSIQYGQIQKNSKKGVFGDVFEVNNNLITTILRTNNKGTSIKIQRFNLDMNLIMSKNIDLISEGKELSYNCIFESNGVYYILLSFKNQKLKKNILFIQTIDKETLLLRDDLKVIETVSYPDTWKSNSGMFDFEFSEDKSRILIYSLSPKLKDKHQNIRISVYNSDVEKLWSNQDNLPVIDKHFDVLDVNINNAGRVFLLAKHFSTGKRTEIKHGESNLSFKLISYSENTNDIKTFTIEHSKYFAEDLKLSFTKEGHVICAGYYSENNESITNGTYFLKLDATTGQKISENYTPFTKSLMNNQDEKPVLSRFYLDHVLVQENNETILIGEYFMSQMYSNGNELKEIYKFGEICAIKLSPAGKIEWIRFIKKYQAAEKTLAYTSYLIHQRESNIYFTFNNKISKIKKKHLKLSKVSCLNLEGNISEVSIDIDPENKKMLIEKYQIEALNKNEILVYYSTKKKIRMAKISY